MMFRLTTSFALARKRFALFENIVAEIAGAAVSAAQARDAQQSATRGNVKERGMEEADPDVEEQSQTEHEEKRSGGDVEYNEATQVHSSNNNNKAGGARTDNHGDRAGELR